MISVTVFVAFIGLVNICMVVAGDSCTTFTTSTDVSEESATLTFSLPESCTRDDKLQLVTVSAKKNPDDLPDDVCQISASRWLQESVLKCILDVKAKEYKVTRRVGPTGTQEEVVLTASIEGQEPVKTSVILQSPITTEVQTTWTPTPAVRSVTTRKPPRPGHRGSTKKIYYSTVDSQNEGADTSEEKGSTPATSEESHTRFTQTAGFGFLIMGTIMAVVLVMIVAYRNKARCLPARRRMRSSLVIPENYERPNVSHLYERPSFRAHPPLPSPPPPAPSADVNRESVRPDSNYALIDDLMVYSVVSK